MSIKNLRDKIKLIIEDNIKPDLKPELKINKFVYHSSNPNFRESIFKDGLITKGKSPTWMEDTPITGKVIFATNSDNKKDWFDSTFDDDIYKIDTSKINNKWYKDPNFDWGDFKHIITFENIPVNAIELIYKGTGKDML